jgi:hypothetical protein
MWVLRGLKAIKEILMLNGNGKGLMGIKGIKA